MSLPYAYCVQTKSVIDIDQAHETFFAQKEPRKRLDFLCPDQGCRDAAKPGQSEITGVNYDKIPGRDEYVRQPHYKFKYNSIHPACCPWGIYSEVLEELEGEMKTLKVSNLKRTNLITKFNPANALENQPEDDYGQIGEIMGFPDRRERRKALKACIRENINNTTQLSRAARCYEAMSQDERRIAPFKIGNLPTKSYHQYFTSAKYCTPEEYYPRIYHGTASVRRYSDAYNLRFDETAWMESEARIPHTVNVRLPHEQFKGFRGKVLLLATLEETIAIGRGAVYLYVFGSLTHLVQNGVHRINVTVDSLHSIAIRLMDEE